MTTDLKRFLAVYDPAGDLGFAGIKFRPGAPLSYSHDGTPTCFGLCEGYRVIDGKITWGYMRYHKGGDRARTPPEVYNPFDCDSPRLDDDGGTVYGSQVRLPTRHGFEVRIAHMDPRSDIRREVLPCLLDHLLIARGELLGVAGRYGISAAIGPDPEAPRHTHTEIVSLDQSCPILDELLLMRYRAEGLRAYEDGEIIDAYRAREMYRHVERRVIMEAWDEERESKGIVWANKYRAVFRRDELSGRLVTRYSAALLFAGM